ncbi:hypothetical protein GUJ93_ZPchr0002g25284 [Zizania palustris]|uniref:Uncharacterized protein n=1 Tax=Zizania palustris TaxID=103762 RepID=A0A8J5S064_ZIZPA|nr:hypothetical protein GUJ93_ZPchr0002g25284 [Zizania palustris]
MATAELGPSPPEPACITTTFVRSALVGSLARRLRSLVYCCRPRPLSANRLTGLPPRPPQRHDNRWWARRRVAGICSRSMPGGISRGDRRWCRAHVR